MLHGFTLYLACVAAFVVGLSKGGLPSIGMLAVPVLSLAISPIVGAALLLPIYVLTDAVGVWLYRRDFSHRNLKVLVPAGLVGVLMGWLLVARVSDRVLGLLLGLLGIAFCLNAWLRHDHSTEARPAATAKGVVLGALAGFSSFISHAGAPPFQAYVLPQKLGKATFAGTSTLFFAIINAAKILPYAQLRPYSVGDLESAAILAPAALIGTLIGARLTRRLADKWFFRVVQGGLFVVSCKLVVDAL